MANVEFNPGPIQGDNVSLKSSSTGLAADSGFGSMFSLNSSYGSNRTTASSRSFTSDYGGSTPSLKKETPKKQNMKPMETIKEMPEVPEVAVSNARTPYHNPYRQPAVNLNLEEKKNSRRGTFSYDGETDGYPNNLTWSFLNFLSEQKKEKRSRKTSPVRQDSSSSLGEAETTNRNAEEKVPWRVHSVSSLPTVTRPARQQSFSSLREEKSSDRYAEEKVPCSESSFKNKSKPASQRRSSSLNSFEDRFKKDKGVNLNIERKLNAEIVENHQENIIEHEEDVPAYKNMPREEILKPEKARRRLKPEVEGNNQEVQCPYCNRRTRTKKDMVKHLTQIHVQEMIQETAESKNISPFSKEFKEQVQKPVDIYFTTKDEKYFEVSINKNLNTGEEQQNIKIDENVSTVDETPVSSTSSKNDLTKSEKAEQTRYKHTGDFEAKSKTSPNNINRAPSEIEYPKKGSSQNSRKEQTKADKKTILSEGENSSKGSGAKELKQQNKKTKGFFHKLTREVEKLFSQDVNPTAKSKSSFNEGSPDISKRKSRKEKTVAEEILTGGKDGGADKKASDKKRDSLKQKNRHFFQSAQKESEQSVQKGQKPASRCESFPRNESANTITASIQPLANTDQDIATTADETTDIENRRMPVQSSNNNVTLKRSDVAADYSFTIEPVQDASSVTASTCSERCCQGKTGAKDEAHRIDNADHEILTAVEEALLESKNTLQQNVPHESLPDVRHSDDLLLDQQRTELSSDDEVWYDALDTLSLQECDISPVSEAHPIEVSEQSTTLSDTLPKQGLYGGAHTKQGGVAKERTNQPFPLIQFRNNDISCYANSIMSAVLNVNCIREYFLTYGENGPIHREIKKLINSQGSEAKSLYLLRHLVTRTDKTGDWTAKRHQDSAEFFESCLRALDFESSKCHVSGPTLDNYFQVKLQQVFQCSNGCPSQYLPSVTFANVLPIPATNCSTIEQSLGQVLNSEDGFVRNCRHCHGSIGRLTTSMETYPQLLLLQLTRFRTVEGVEKKIDRRITTPETLHFAQDGTSYSLTSAVVHSGTPTAGHYITLIRCPLSGNIFTVDDHRAVKPYDATTNMLHKSYLLVYQRNPDNGIQDRAVHCASEDIEDAASTSAAKSCDNPDRRKSTFEELLSDLGPAKTNALLEQYGIKKQNAIKRRKEDLRRYFLKNVEEQSDILRSMTVADTRYNPGNHANESGDQAHTVSESDNFELPSPPYVPQAISQRDPVVDVENLLATADGPTLNRILRSMNVTPQNSLARRRAQLKKILPSCNITAILRDLKNDSERVITSGTHPVQSEEAMDIDLPSPPYVPLNQQRISDLDDTECINALVANPAPTETDDGMNEELPSPGYVPLNQHSISEQEGTEDSRHNIDSWSLTRLQDYINIMKITCHSKQNINNLKKIVCRHVFDSLVSQAPASIVDKLMSKYGIKKHTGIQRKQAQLRAYFLKTRNQEILKYLEENSTRTEAGVPQPSEYISDFLPLNIESIMEKRSEIVADREARIAALNEGNFRLVNENGTNRILEAGREFHEELRKIEMETCTVCKEQWFEMNVGSRSGKCQRCTNDRIEKNTPHTFSPENDMYPGLPPTCLSILNSTEVAAISLICPQITIYKLKGGATGMKGHSISFYQDVQGFVDRLPRRPEQLPIVVIKSPNQKVDLKANRFNIMNALEYLVKYNPEYKNIVIDREALDCYPSNSHTSVENIYAVDSSDVAHHLPVQPVESLDDNTGVLDDQDIVSTAAPFQMPTLPVEEQIREAFQRQDRATEPLTWPDRGGAASEWEYGYFSKAFPNLFPKGEGDLTKTRLGKNPEFLPYIRHLTRLPGTQFASDQRFLLHVCSMYRRQKALTLGNVFGTKVFKNLTIAELKEKVAQDDEAVIKSLVLFSSQIPGTKGYFSQEAKKSVALERWIRIKSGGEEMLNTFLTFSLADQHLDDLHRLLPGHEAYLGKTVVDNLEDIPDEADPADYIDKKTDYNLRMKAVADNGHIVDYYASKRLDCLVDHVLRDTLGICDYVVRSEYQGRKAVHWHMAARTLGIRMEDIQNACRKYDFDVRCSTEEEQQMDGAQREEYRKYLISEGFNPDNPSSEELKAVVTESRDKVISFVTKDLGLSAVHPEADPKQWPGPEGQDVSAPPTNCLRDDYLQLTDYESDYLLLINRCMLHACKITYCLIQLELLNATVCRFGFPLLLRGFTKELTKIDDKEILDKILRNEEFAKAAEFVLGTLELLRNHPRLVAHIPELLPIWRGNIDMKLIKSPESLLKYILKYIMKPEAGSLAFTDIIKTLTANADDTTEPRKIFQKILMKTVGEHDISKNEAWRIVSGKPFVQYSRLFRNLNLTENRRINVDAENPEAQALTKTFCDLYWARDTDENYLKFVQGHQEGRISYPMAPKDVSLYNFASDFNAHWRPSQRAWVPKPTPIFHYVPAPTNEKFRQPYCETTLLLHKPGTTPANMVEGFDDAEAALLDFVTNDERCPKVVRDEHLNSLKMTEEDVQQLLVNVEDLVPAPGSQNVQVNQDDWMIGLGDPIKVTDINDPEPEMEDFDDENVETEWDKDADWTADRQLLGMDNQQIKDAGDWVKQQRVVGDLDTAEEELIDIDSLNPDQRAIYNAVMDAVLTDGEQKLVDISGGAGTGKSYLIRALLQRSEKRIKIAAPTGCAAQQFAGGQTIHSMLRIPPKMGCKQLEDLSPVALKELQSAFKETRALIIDEKGMIGLGRLKQIDGRLKEIRPLSKNKAFGGITIVLAGDFRQLPPVGDLPLFSTKGGQIHQGLGRNLYRMFDQSSYLLRSQMRQQGEENALFREQLERLATGNFTQADWTAWSGQNYDTMDRDVQETFYNTATMLCAKKMDSVQFNLTHLRKTGNPVAKLSAVNSRGAAAYEADHANGLRNKVYLAKGAKIVLTSNIWPEAKLVNGTKGTVAYMVFREQQQALPDLVICHFPEYTGPTFIPGQDKMVPIAPMQASWTVKGQQFSRTQYPLMLGWAITIHKGQGMTLGKVIINLSDREFSNGLTYTAVTRVRRLSDIAFRPFPNFVRFVRIFAAASFKERVNEEQKKMALYRNLMENDDIEMLDLTQMETVRQETCLQDCEALLQKLITNSASGKSNIGVLGELATQILLKLDQCDPSAARKSLIERVFKFGKELESCSVMETEMMIDEPLMVSQAIESARKHHIDLCWGLGNEAAGNCAFEAVINNVNERSCYDDKLPLDVRTYRHQWMTELQQASKEHDTLGADFTDEEKQENWDNLKTTGTWDIEFFGDLVMHGIAMGCRKNILIFNTTTAAGYPVYTVEASQFGGSINSPIPVVLAYNGNHYESMHPVTEQDIAKTMHLFDTIIRGEYGFQRQDIPGLVKK